MAARTWEARELPVLQAVARADRDERAVADVQELAKAVGIEVKAARRRTEALQRAGFIRGVDASSAAAYDLISIELTEKGHRAVGHWPSPDSYEDLIRVLDDKITATQDPEEQSRLIRFRDGALALGTKVGSELLTAWIRSQTGI